ncbi:hypothetical protein NDU88_004011 [Pleurodeles waltl]|uniref:Uncharacterized protein n=1 Tax=Pleurodeles waltl TaxID=8319 RepID=A0AAV7VJG2_PLEWA|nr:hypothetical protein NDU88_004011 [Pleurodeles waltl]
MRGSAAVLSVSQCSARVKCLEHSRVGVKPHLLELGLEPRILLSSRINILEPGDVKVPVFHYNTGDESPTNPEPTNLPSAWKLLVILDSRYRQLSSFRVDLKTEVISSSFVWSCCVSASGALFYFWNIGLPLFLVRLALSLAHPRALLCVLRAQRTRLFSRHDRNLEARPLLFVPVSAGSEE